MSTADPAIPEFPHHPSKDGWLWPDETRELAFELYMLQAGRYLPHVARLLYEDHDIQVPPRTLRYWRDVDQWDVKADERLTALAPNLRERTAVNLTVAALHASQSLLRITAGEERADRFVIMADVAALNAAGFSSSSHASRDTSSRSNHDNPSRSLPPGDAPLTRDQLLERERERRRRG